MGSSTSARQLAGKLVAAGKAIESSKRAGITLEAQVVKNALLAAPGAPHHVAGKIVGVRYKLNSDESALVSWYGPVHLVNNPTRAHEIRPRAFVGTRGTGSRAQRGASLLAAFGVDAHSSGAIRLADGQVRSRVQHPGTRGKQFFEKGKQVAEKVGPPAFQSVLHRSLIGVFG